MAAGRGFAGRYDGGGVRWSCGDARALFDPRLNKKRSRRLARAEKRVEQSLGQQHKGGAPRAARSSRMRASFDDPLAARGTLEEASTARGSIDEDDDDLLPGLVAFDLDDTVWYPEM